VRLRATITAPRQRNDDEMIIDEKTLEVLAPNN
jgi:hypothetical protein